MQSTLGILFVLLVAGASPFAFCAQPLKPGELIGINPQPEPPLPAGQKILKPGTAVGINPQPEPPGALKPQQR